MSSIGMLALKSSTFSPVAAPEANKDLHRELNNLNTAPYNVERIETRI